MKTKIYIKALAALCAASAILAGCRKDDLVQEEPLVKLSYESLTGLIPNGSVTVSPEITSGEPTDFSISSVFLGEFAYKGGMFSIDSKTGAVTVAPAADAAAGEYIVSVNCVSPEGKKYIFKNALSATVISGMPQLTVTPASLSLKFEDLQPSSDAILLTAQVAATGDAAKVTGYELRNLRKDGNPVEEIGGFFNVDASTGIVSALKGEAWTIGKYVMDIKVNTESFDTDSVEGLIADALTVNVSAEPVVVNYLETPAFAPNITRTFAPTVTGPVPSGYAISKVTLGGAEYSGAEFSIDPATGVVTASGKEDTAAGEYKVSITYKYAGQDLSSNDALTVKCLPGVPEGLLVNPSAASVEDKDIAAGSSAELPVFTLATNGESAAVTGYEVKAVRKDGVDFAFTGLVTVENNTVRIQHGSWPLGDYTFDIKVNTESFGSASDKGVFKDVFTLTVFEKLELAYDSATKKEHTLWSVSPLTPMPAGYTYSFTDPAASYTAFISLDPSTGVLSALKGNNLPKGSHLVSVTASAPGQESSTAIFALEVVENPYYFTYFSYGNNLDLTEEQTDGVSQFRVKSKDELGSLTCSVQFTDLKQEAGAVFVSKLQNLNNATVASDGTLSFGALTSGQVMEVILVTATTTDPDDEANTWSVTVPVCVDHSYKESMYVRYSPFVLRVNPKTGGRSAAPALKGMTSGSFLMDYRRDFNYLNINGKDKDGNAFAGDAPAAGRFLGYIWDDFSAATGLNLSSGATNYGGKLPMSYYNGTALKTEEQYALTPAYVDGSEGAAQFSVVVNPGLWQHNGGWADGVFIGQMTYVNDGNVSSVNTGTQIFPLAIWFDPTFEK